MRIIKVNHGQVFRKGENWYTFYCPHCKEQITRWNSKIICEHCKKEIEWES